MGLLSKTWRRLRGRRTDSDTGNGGAASANAGKPPITPAQGNHASALQHEKQPEEADRAVLSGVQENSPSAAGGRTALQASPVPVQSTSFRPFYSMGERRGAPLCRDTCAGSGRSSSAHDQAGSAAVPATVPATVCAEPLEPARTSCSSAHSAPHRTSSTSCLPPYQTAARRRSSCCGPLASSAMDVLDDNDTSIESVLERTLGFETGMPIEYGMPGWERQLTQQIAACTGMSAASSRRASESSSYLPPASTLLALQAMQLLPSNLQTAPSATSAGSPLPQPQLPPASSSQPESKPESELSFGRGSSRVAAAAVSVGAAAAAAFLPSAATAATAAAVAAAAPTSAPVDISALAPMLPPHVSSSAGSSPYMALPLSLTLPPMMLDSSASRPRALSVRVSSMRASFGQVVLPQQLLHKAAEHGADLHLDLQRDVVVDTSRPLGSGQFGSVYAGTYRGSPVAIKSLRPLIQGCTIDELEVFVQEITVLCGLRHDNVVRLLGGCLQPPDICLVEELCAISLDAVLHRRDKAHDPAAPSYAAAAAGACAAAAAASPFTAPAPAAAPEPPTPEGGDAWAEVAAAPKVPPPPATGTPLPLHRVLEVALDVALGLQYLHSRTPAVVHRDLKPSNILLNASGRAKISDFGLARCKYSAYIDTNRPETGSMAYMAPECWDPELEGGLTDKMDIFSYGVVLWELVTGERPWATCRMADFVHRVVSKGARLKVPTNDNICPYSLRVLISSCTEERPSERPDIGQIISELQRMLKYCRRDNTASC